MKRNLLISFLILVAMIILMRWQGSTLVTPQSAKGIIDLEFAKTPAKLQQLQFFWNHETVLQNIYLDFLFISAYTWFLFTACKAVNNSKSNLFSGLTISAAAFDVLENFLLILVWNEKFSPSILQIVFYVAAIKFLLIIIIIGYLILSLFGLFKRESSV
jgi:hypothetical protein